MGDAARSVGAVRLAAEPGPTPGPCHDVPTHSSTTKAKCPALEIAIYRANGTDLVQMCVGPAGEPGERAPTAAGRAFGDVRAL